MGNDGGSIPTRRELVKSASRAPTVSELKATALESLSHAWAHDALTASPLSLDNVVSDWRGRLYNYETILENLVPGADDDKATPPAANGELTFAATGIRSLRDVVKLRFTRYAPAGEAKRREVWACPVSLKELGPATKAVYLVPCGHVFAEAGLRSARADGICPECSEPFRPEDVVDILPTEKADLERLSRRVEDLAARGLTHSMKKDKGQGKKKKRKAADEARLRAAEDAGKRPEKGRAAEGEPVLPRPAPTAASVVSTTP